MTRSTRISALVLAGLAASCGGDGSGGGSGGGSRGDGGDTTPLAPTATSLLVSGVPSSVTAGEVVSGTLTAKDGAGATVIDYRGTVRFTSSDSAAQLPADHTFAPADRGSYAFTITFKTGGTQTLTAIDVARSFVFGRATVTVNTPFSQTGSMVFARARHTATALPDGTVLVVGGFISPFSDASGPYSSAELYNPTTANFTLTGPLGHERGAHTATLLPDGKVLVAGGWNATLDPDSTAELYDPTTRSFSPTGSMATGRVYHTATLLPNGKALIVGGMFPRTGEPEDLASAELYDPATGLFSPTGSLLTGRWGHTTTLLPNGNVLIVGGRTDGAFFASAELYAPETGTFTPTGSMATGRISHTATLVPNGKVLIAGGGTSYAIFASSEIYDPSTGSFRSTGNMAVQRSSHSASLLPTGQVLIAGGTSAAGFPNVWMTAELFDPISGVFAPAGQMANAHAEHQATALSEGAVLVTGGIGNLWGNDGLPLATATAEVYRELR
jgi:galactose oxidase-like protein/Kelch motif protein